MIKYEIAEIVPISGPQSNDVKRTPWICQLLLSGIFERDRSSWGKIIDDGTIDVTSYSLKDVSNIDRINVLFADCEGCLESFFDEYEWFLKQLRLVIYEKDQLHICNYEKIEKLLEKHGFYLVESKDNNFIWEK